MNKLSVLLVDDDPMILKAMKNVLLVKDAQIQVDIASSVMEATSKIESEKQAYDAIVGGINIPKIKAIERKNERPYIRAA